jgi:hypothetical protein
MPYKTVTVDVEVYVDDVISDADSDDLIWELEKRGYYISKNEVEEELLTDEEKDYICSQTMNGNSIIERSIYEKLRKQ